MEAPSPSPSSLILRQELQLVSAQLSEQSLRLKNILEFFDAAYGGVTTDLRSVAVVINTQIEAVGRIGRDLDVLLAQFIPDKVV